MATLNLLTSQQSKSVTERLSEANFQNIAGKIAKKFAQGLATLPDAELVAVGSRSAKTAQAFAQEYKVSNVHASYEALAQDPEIEVIYVATPHPYHVANTNMCLEAGKAVLCEKACARDSLKKLQNHINILL